MRKTNFLALGVLVLMVLGLFFNTGSGVVSAEEANKTSIEITGKGTIKAKPDAAKITLGIKTQGNSAEEAQKENAKQMDTVIKAITAEGIPSDKVETTSYTIYPLYQYVEKEGKSVIYGYEVNNSIKVTIEDIDKTGNVIDAAVASGINVTNNIMFYVKDYDKYYYEALGNAVTDAKAKANSIAKMLGFEVSNPVSVVEMNNYSSPIYYRDNYMMEAAKADASYDYLQVQELEITAEVKVTY